MRRPYNVYVCGYGWRELTRAQYKVLEAFQDHGFMTDFQLGYAYRLTHGDLDQTWSGLRTRRSELVDMRIIEEKSRIRNENNRQVAVWGASGAVAR